jgi:hypothetical protein
LPNEICVENQPVEYEKKARENSVLIPPTILLRDLAAHVAPLASDRSDVSRRTWKTGLWQRKQRGCLGE